MGIEPIRSVNEPYRRVDADAQCTRTLIWKEPNRKKACCDTSDHYGVHAAHKDNDMWHHEHVQP